MPELAEVEVVRQTLESCLVGQTIEGIDCFYAPILENQVDDFKCNVIGHRIEKIHRYAKYLLFGLDNGWIVCHLRMEGKLYYLSEPMIDKHTHVVFHLSSGNDLVYKDVRKFGRMIFKKDNELFQTAPLLHVGVEANCSCYDLAVIYNKIHRKKIPIKTILLDQRIISGLGNIYADEVLYQAHLSPLRPGNTLQKEDVAMLMQVSKQILDQAIAYKGTTIRSYASSLGVYGSYQQFLKVHTKTECPMCHAPLEKIKIGGRTSYYCSRCQH